MPKTAYKTFNPDSYYRSNAVNTNSFPNFIKLKNNMNSK